jgi:hypothetical protein
MIGSMLLAAGRTGVAAEAAAEPAFATVWRIEGEVTAGDPARSVPRRLQPGDPVFVGERIQAAATGEAVLRTADAGLIAVRPGAVFAAERFVARGERRDSATFRIFSGALRVLTGWIGKLNRSEHRIVTPSATIGVRGTDHEPYVLTEELAARLGQKAGTYDKVNRGGTTLESGAGAVEIDPGRVGFAKAPAKTRTRALMTLALPVLLDRVPDFYVPGRFDDEIDRIAATLEAEADEALEKQRRSGASAASSTAATAPRPPSPLEMTGRARRDDPCEAGRVARDWLRELDRGIAAGDVNAILSLFDGSIVLRVTARGRDGSQTTVELPREEFARSAAEAVASLREFRQQRPNVDARPLAAGRCDLLTVRSVSIEQGRQGDTPYRFESLEEYRLEQRGQRWIATRAESTQR